MKKAIIDIDGVLNNYPYNQIQFFNDELGTEFKTLSDAKNALSYNEYKEMKKRYRQSSAKHDAPLTVGAREMIDYLKANDYLIYIVTSRQLFTENQLEKTITWLKKNGINYDYIYCSIKKDFTIFEKFGHIDFAIEDNVNNIENIKQINGDDAFYFNVINIDNEDRACTCKRVYSLFEVIEHMEAEKRVNCA